LVVAGYAGYTFGVALANGFYFIWQNDYFYWSLIVVFTIGVLVLTFSGVNKHMIWVTAVFGAYIFFRSIALLLGHYPVIQDLPSLVKTGAI
jgi:hypothetical protein